MIRLQRYGRGEPLLLSELPKMRTDERLGSISNKLITNISAPPIWAQNTRIAVLNLKTLF